MSRCDPLRSNCWFHRGTKYTRHWHYKRHRLEDDNDPSYRAPSGDSRFRNRIPAIMETRKYDDAGTLPYNAEDLNRAIGSVENPIAGHNINANALGWSQTGHSDDRAVTIDDEIITMWFPMVWNWFDQLVNPQGTLMFVPIGKE